MNDGISEGSHENGGTKQPLRQTNSPDDEPVRKATGRCDHFERWEREEMARLLGELNGHLGNFREIFVYECCGLQASTVVYPTKFLEGEDSANNFLFNADRRVSFRDLQDDGTDKLSLDFYLFLSTIEIP